MKTLRTMYLTMVCAVLSYSVNAEDIDIYQYQKNDLAGKPNVLILLDNTANWNTLFDVERAALTSVVSGLDDNQRVGLMLFSETGSPNDNIDGGYVRYGIREMTGGTVLGTNKGQLLKMLGELDVLADKSNGGKVGLTMAEAWAYFVGATSRSGIGKAKRDYSGNLLGNAYTALLPNSPFDNAFDRIYNSPVLDLNCQKNYIIYISNGAAQDNNSDTTTAKTLLAAEGGSTTTIPLSPSSAQTNVADEWARFMSSHNLVDINNKLLKPHVEFFTIDVFPTSSGQGPGWSEMLRSIARQGKGGEYFRIVPCTTVGCDPTAQAGKDIAKALSEAFDRINAVDSVFASVTLPVSVNVRGTYLNQVYMGVFRPDGDASPAWPGNLKLYQLGLDSGVVKLTDSANNSAADGRGFVLTTAKSFWTTDSTDYWKFKYPDAPSDFPDGNSVEKGGAAQRLRVDFATSQAARSLYTCTGTCDSREIFGTGNASLVSEVDAVTTVDPKTLINWVRGQDQKDENGNLNTDDMRAYVHGDVLHSRPSVINYGDSRGIVVYYGANDGVFHAVKGGTSGTGVGSELWGFVFPEFHAKLARIYDNAPVISTTDPKPYFADGVIGSYVLDSNEDGVAEKVYLYITMRRGDRAIYALDVTTPSDPKIMWRKTEADFPELGYTWSEAKVSKIAASSNPVIVMGGGYDPAADDKGAARTMGRAIYILDAVDGNLIKAFTSTDNAALDGAVAADVAVINRDDDINGYADRFYAATTNGKVFRGDISDVDPANWKLYLLADLGGTGADARRFLYKPDVVLGSKFDSVLLGSGDREQPFSESIKDNFYMLADRSVGLTVSSADNIDLVQGDLVNAATATQPLVIPLDKFGWYLPMSGSGEKVIGNSTTLGGVTFFATNRPVPPAENCGTSLGDAKVYGISYLTAQNIKTDDLGEGVGGFIPSPVPVVVDICDGNPQKCKPEEAVIMGTMVFQPPIEKYGQRYRTYWYKRQDKK